MGIRMFIIALCESRAEFAGMSLFIDLVLIWGFHESVGSNTYWKRERCSWGRDWREKDVGMGHGAYNNTRRRMSSCSLNKRCQAEDSLYI